MSDKLFKIRLQKGDLVKVRSGSNKGKTGKVLEVINSENKVVVQGINVVKKHQKPTKTQPQGGIIEVTKPINVSKVGFVAETKDKPSKIGYKIVDKKKVRVAKKTNKRITK